MTDEYQIPRTPEEVRVERATLLLEMIKPLEQTVKTLRNLGECDAADRTQRRIDRFRGHCAHIIDSYFTSKFE